MCLGDECTTTLLIQRLVPVHDQLLVGGRFETRLHVDLVGTRVAAVAEVGIAAVGEALERVAQGVQQQATRVTDRVAVRSGKSPDRVAIGAAAADEDEVPVRQQVQVRQRREAPIRATMENADVVRIVRDRIAELAPEQFAEEEAKRKAKAAAAPPAPVVRPATTE